MTISLRLNEADSMLFKKNAELHGISVSELLRRSVIEIIEVVYDLQAYEVDIAEYHENPITYSLDEVEKELGLG